MPASQPSLINVSPEANLEQISIALQDLSRQLNYIFADIYWLLDEARGLEGQTFSPYSSTMGGFGVPSELTILGGKVSVSGTNTMRYHKIDTESDAASDALDTISGGEEGDLLLLRAENSSRTVVVTAGASLRMNGNFSLTSVRDMILFVCAEDGVWDEISRRSNA